MVTIPFSVESVDRNSGRIDWPFLATLFAMIVVGLTMLLSASVFKAQQLYDEPLRFVARQAMWVAVGGVVGAVAAIFPLQLLRKHLPLLVVGGIVLASLTLVPGVGARYMGARRWIFVFNVSFQPSELLKLILVVYLAHIFARRAGDFTDPVSTVLPPAVIVFLSSGIVLLQNDYSTAMFLVVVALMMFYAGGVPLVHFGRLFGVVVPVSAILLFTKEHRVQRLIGFLRPEYDPTGTGYQILAARRALRSGGLWGVGIGGSSSKLGLLPEAHADFLFAVVGEELGFVGVTAIFALFAYFAYRGLRHAFLIEDQFRSLLLFGLTCSILLQALLNLAVVVGAVPATGIPLPFFSSGGSALLVYLTMAGLMVNAIRSDGEASDG